MALEIERKFLVKPDFNVKDYAVGTIRITQAYLSDNPDATVRVRISDDKAYLTVKSRNEGAVRNEWEYSVPLEEAEAMVRIAPGGVIDKTRYLVPFEGRQWEVDVFHRELEGLILAEIELSSPTETIIFPNFLGREVTGDFRYYNSYLCKTAIVPE